MLKLLALKCVLRINSFLHEIAEGIAHQTFQTAGEMIFTVFASVYVTS